MLDTENSIEKLLAENLELNYRLRVEESLERVRQKAIAMRSPDDLADTLNQFYKELMTLGTSARRVGVALVKDNARLADIFTMSTSETGETSNTRGELILGGHPVLDGAWENWLKQKEWHTTLRGKEINEYYSIVRPQLALPDYPNDVVQYGYLFFFPEGALYVWLDREIEDKTLDIFRRMQSVISLTYKRYKELLDAELRTKKIEDTLTELRAMQTQLIHAEKMASLGELTAGIAHEIQNPLNFVNNFSEINEDLLAELITLLDSDQVEEIKSLAGDIADNEKKIHFHGKRAESIVKNMLQHSRKSSGQKEAVDINALVEEYFTLAYHGLRAKYKAFNANLKTELDPTVGRVKIYGQEIGRAILNLVNNAFQAIREKMIAGTDNDYKPEVIVVTKRLAGKIIIEVTDNGSGIPENIIDKIFQPFFTTKPSGEGTGLGLSLTYDIVKAHGGQLRMVTKLGKGSSFTIELPAE